MVNLLIALTVVIGGWWALRQLGKAQPQQIRTMFRKAAGAGVMLAAAVLAMRGAMQIAGPLFVLGLGMFSNVGAFVKNGAFWKKAEGQKSKVRTSIIEMELDHDTGTMSGTVLAGPLKGRKLSGLVDGELSLLHAQCASAADQSMALLDAWLHRNRPGYHATGNKSDNHVSSSAKMTRQEAIAILGLGVDPTPEDIKNAHRNLMKQFHPDRGGTDYLASKINQAKDTLG